MLHAKAAIIDDVLALAGSTNLDGRSLFLNYELMAAFHDAGDIARFTAWFDFERRAASPYDAQPPGLCETSLKGWCCGSASSSDLASELRATDVPMRYAGAAATYQGASRMQVSLRAETQQAG